MRKILASLLAVVMVACCFATISVSAADEAPVNVLAGAAYTNVGDSTPKPDGAGMDTGKLLTDGVVRAGEQFTAAGGPAAGISVEYQGSNKTTSVEFTFDAATIATVVLGGVRRADAAAGLNRSLELTKIETTADGLTWTDAAFTQAAAAIEGAAKASNADKTAEYDQYWNITATLSAVAKNVTGLRVTWTQSTYVSQLDEISAYSAAASAPETSEAAPETSEAAPETSEAAPETSEAAPETSVADESKEEVKPADITYTVTYTPAEDGKTATITATLPEGIANGKIVLVYSDKLTLAVDAENEAIVDSDAGAEINTTEAGKITASFAKSKAMKAGTVALTATFNVKEGAEITADDITVPTWELGDGTNMVSDNTKGDVIKVLPTVETETSVVDTTSKEGTEPTGDAGIAVFAVLAVISAGAVVVLKKRA